MFFLPFFSGLFGGGAAAGATAATTATGAAAAGATAGGLSGLGMAATGLSLFSTLMSGKAQKDAYKREADQEKLNAKENELERRRNLLVALASQNATRAAQGISINSGSPAAMMRSDVRASEYSGTVSNANSSYRIADAEAAGNNAMTSSLLSAGTTLLDTWDRARKRR